LRIVGRHQLGRIQIHIDIFIFRIYKKIGKESECVAKYHALSINRIGVNMR
jgi:hypothetical protein